VVNKVNKIYLELNNWEIIIVPIMNPSGRIIVEKGKYCWRSTSKKIDPNRNWSFKHNISSEEDRYADADGGNMPFTI
jgi:hypothetical protein